MCHLREGGGEVEVLGVVIFVEFVALLFFETQGPEAVELGHGAVELAVDEAFVADEALQIGGIGEDDSGRVEGDVAVVLIERCAGCGCDGTFVGDGSGFKAVGAVEAPVADGDALDETLFAAADGLKVGLELGLEGDEVFEALVAVVFEDKGTWR